MKNSGSSKSRIFLGSILILIGLLIFGDNINLFGYDISYYIFSWHAIMFIVGAIILANSRSNVMGYIFLGIPVVSIASDYFNISIGELFDNYWPLILIGIGALILFKRDKKNSKDFKDCGQSFNNHGESVNSSEDYVDITTIFNGRDVYVTTNNFSGGEVNSIFGGSNVDLSSCKLAPGTNVLEANSIFGGNELRVPDDWNLVVNVTSVFGGIDDKRRSTHEKIIDPEKTLIIKGSAIFGGLEIKN